jgi:hypothetical protein
MCGDRLALEAELLLMFLLLVLLLVTVLQCLALL